MATNYYRELGVTGNRRIGGGQAGYEIETREGLPELQDARSRYRIYSEMRDNSPIINAVMFAVTMLLQRVSFFHQAASDKSEDKLAAEFMDGVLGDMSLTWQSTLSDILTFLQYGFVPMEIVFKKRMGQQPPQDRPVSRFNDGLVGLRKLAYRHQETLAPGGGWLLDETGGVQGIVQEHPDTGKLLQIPIEKLLLFRTTNDPEGKSIYRGMWIPYYYVRELQDVEAIAAERLGAGYPVAYLGEDRSLEGTNSDYDLVRRALENIRIDEQMCLVFPGPKLYTEGGRSKGFLFELVSPPSRGTMDFEAMISRYQHEMAMSVLASFIFLGLEKIGTQALAVRSTDIFGMALDAYAGIIKDTWNRHLVPKVWKVNQFPLEAVEGRVAKARMGVMPELDSSQAGLPDLAGMAEFVNSLVGAQVLTPGIELERYLRQLAGLPDVPETVEAGRGQSADGSRQEAGGSGQSADGSRQEAEGRGEEVEKQERPDSQFILGFEAALEEIYTEWYQGLAGELIEEEDEGERAAILAAALLALRTRLAEFFRAELPAAIMVGTGGEPLTPAGMAELAGVLAATEDYLGEAPTEEELLALAAGGAFEAGDTLMQALGRKVMVGLRDVLLVAGGLLSLQGLFATLWGRLASYSGQAWQAIQRGIGDIARKLGARVRWVIDPVPHQVCETCQEFGNREYDSYDGLLLTTGGVLPSHGTRCDGNCRCWLEYQAGRQWIRL